MKRVAMLLALATGDFGSNKRKRQVRTLPRFSSVTLNGLGTVHLHQGPQEVVITMDERLFDLFVTEVKGRVLHMGFSHWSLLRSLWFLFQTDKGRIDITLPEIEAVNVNGKGTVLSDPLTAESLEVALHGASSITLQGNVSKLRIVSTGAARFEGRHLVAERCSVKMNGSGRIEIEAKEKLNASVIGAGKLVYWGEPKVTVKTTGASTVKKGEDRK
ncbi:Protein of unknown function (DUF2807) [Sphaerochaeta pleomorpha str. Grapes]|uniref:Putative auto-transporter adhesin head GIN domain-containing protein n=1 Tax=Sphaerochaeta pleomorpha (strain ATCC BAA-1885 / DSM 22778 / Grapes) TaxID=158190 RepID=G8QTA0_SPHPG|nr:head GIN domain-containing protein [Sphaerochaeta pleomorpha]AEV29067.1 Protein of unknown function (DUF2807) [Sphaerochaeta pleomorpha str. Grapes]